MCEGTINEQSFRHDRRLIRRTSVAVLKRQRRNPARAGSRRLMGAAPRTRFFKTVASVEKYVARFIPLREKERRDFFPGWTWTGTLFLGPAGPSRNEADIFRDGHLAGLADPVGGPVLQWLKSCYIPRSAVSSAFAFTDERRRRERGWRCMVMLLFSPSSSCVCSPLDFYFLVFFFFSPFLFRLASLFVFTRDVYTP